MSNGQKKSYIEYCRLQVTFMQVMANTIKTFSSFECNKQTTIKVNNLQDVFQAVVNTMINDWTGIWNSAETYKLYQSCVGSKFSRRALVWRLSDILPNFISFIWQWNSNHINLSQSCFFSIACGRGKTAIELPLLRDGETLQWRAWPGLSTVS